MKINQQGGKEHIVWYSFHLKGKQSFIVKPCRIRLLGGIKRLTHAISARPAGPTLRAVFSTNEEVIPGAPCPVVTAPTVLKYTATWMTKSRNKITLVRSLKGAFIVERNWEPKHVELCHPTSPCYISFISTLLNSSSSSYTTTEYKKHIAASWNRKCRGKRWNGFLGGWSFT